MEKAGHGDDRLFLPRIHPFIKYMSRSIFEIFLSRSPLVTQHVPNCELFLYEMNLYHIS